MTSNIFLNKRYFLNTLPPFNGARFEIWKVVFRIFIRSIDFELRENLINEMFMPTHQTNGEVVDKLDSLWTVEETINFQIYFKTNNFLVMSLYDSKILYVYNCKTAKEMWDNLEIIYGVSPKVKQEEMNTPGDNDEGIIHQWFLSFRIERNYIGLFSTNQYLRVKNLKLNLILKSKDGSIHKFQEKTKTGIFEMLKELVQQLKDEGFNSNTEESLPTSSNSYQTTPMVSFKRIYSVIEWSSEDSTSSEEPYLWEDVKKKKHPVES